MTAPDPSETNRSTRAFLFTPWIKESCEAFHTKHTQREALNCPRRGTLVRGPLIATSTNNPARNCCGVMHIPRMIDGSNNTAPSDHPATIGTFRQVRRTRLYSRLTQHRYTADLKKPLGYESQRRCSRRQIEYMYVLPRRGTTAKATVRKLCHLKKGSVTNTGGPPGFPSGGQVWCKPPRYKPNSVTQICV